MPRKTKSVPVLLLTLGILATSSGRGQTPPPNPAPAQPSPPPAGPPEPPVTPQPPPTSPQPTPPARPPQGPETDAEPVIVEQPKSQQVKSPATATFSVTATGNPVPKYQWSLNGDPINGATRSTYTTGPTTLANDGDTYTVTVSNGVGNPVTSDPAILNVIPS